MQKKYEENLKKVEEITNKFDNFEIEETKAKEKFDEGNKLLDECAGMIKGTNQDV